MKLINNQYLAGKPDESQGRKAKGSKVFMNVRYERDYDSRLQLNNVR